MKALLYCMSGACFGSFICCMAHRRIRKENLWKRSHCDNCKEKLGIKDLVPVFSYLSTKGKCRYCKKEISIEYPLIEITASIIMMVNLRQCPYISDFIERTLLEYLLLYIAIYDGKTCLIEQWAILAGIMLRLLTLGIARVSLKTVVRFLLNGAELSLSVLLVSLVVKRLLKKDVLGNGDIELLFMTGIYNSFIINHFILLFSCFIQIIVFAYRKGADDNVLPFAPAIAISFFLVTIFQNEILSIYSRIILFL